MTFIFRKGKKFFLKTYVKEEGERSRFLGKVTRISFGGDDEEVFISHMKDPSKHFYIHGRGYPINEELLHMLKNAGIELIIIPEDGKSGFYTKMVGLHNYLNGLVVIQKSGERQRCVPLEEFDDINVDKKTIESILYS